MDLGITGRTALVLGAGGGLGSAIARTLAAEGANVVLADINIDALAGVQAELEQRGTRTLALAWDLMDLAIIQPRIAEIERRFGSVDILVNNTGGPPPTTVHDQPEALWLSSFQAMVLSVIKITDQVLAGMRRQQWGRIITSTSSGVVAPIANLGLSNALRVSLLGWSKTLAREVARDGITSNVILPGRIATDRIQFLDQAKAQREGRAVESVREESTGSIPVGRYGTPQEYAQAVAFLASNCAAYITGSVIRVDGGLIASI